MANKLVTNVMIFDGTGKKPYLGEVLVQGNRIKTVAKGKDQIARDGAEVVDGGGATLLPGFINIHAHTTYLDTTTLASVGDVPPEEATLQAMHNARLVHDCGFTAVISAAASKPRLDVVIRNEINAGRIPGPRMKACTTQFVTTSGPWDARQMHMHHESFSTVMDGPVEVRRKTREMIREGVDMVKIALSGDNFSAQHSDEHSVTWAEDEIAACVEVAHSRNVKVCAHARSDESIRLCIKHGIEFIHHATYASEKTLDLLEKHKDRFWVAPALGAIYATLHEASDWGMDKEFALARHFDREIEVGCQTMMKMFKRGIKVLPYGDYGVAWNPHGTDHRDLEHFTNLIGFTPEQTLMMATKWGGEAWASWGGGVEMGQVKAGFLADMVMVEGDPLADITLFQDRDNFLMIMKDGQYHKAPQARRAAGRKRVAAE